MTKIITAILILVSVSQIHSQDFSKNELDSLYNLFTFVRGINQSDKMQQIFDENPEIKKCGLGLVTSVKQNFLYFSNEQQSVLSKLLERSERQVSVVSSNGFFRIHYDTSGINAIGYDVNLLLQALDSTYNFEIIYLGYPTPPTDGIEGGDEKYDVYILNLGPGYYGITTWENNVGITNWTSFIEIDNDFGENFNTHGIDAARATVAHEFHHAIQLGNYAQYNNTTNPIRGIDVNFFEISSTAMEEFVFDDVDDYRFYIRYYFQNPENAILNTSFDGYDLAIWNIYLQKNFGFDILKNQWGRVPTTPAIKSIALSLIDFETTLGNELNRFGIWCYYTGSRNIFPGEYFEEADEYPLLSPTATMNFNLSSQIYDMTVNPTANYFLKINLPSPDGEFVSIFTNSDWQKAIDSYTQFLDFSFTIYQDSSLGDKAISENYSVSFSRDNQTFWNNAGILNNEVVYGDTSYNISEIESETFAYPIPYKKSSAGKIRFAFQSVLFKGDEVNLNIYSAGLGLLYAGNPIIRSSYLKDLKKYCEVVLDDSDINFATGVYIYVIKSGDDIYKGKMVIFND